MSSERTLGFLAEGHSVDALQRAAYRLIDQLDVSIDREGDVYRCVLRPRASDMLVALRAAGPIVHCLAGADALRAGFPAVPSEAPADQQASWLRKLVPAARTVGLLFDPSTNQRRAEAVAAALDVAGYKALMQPVSNAAALPSAPTVFA